MSERTGPLSDVRILDLTQALAGPFGTAVLADLGADVIKVEPPSGDMSRPMAPLLEDFAPPGSNRAAGCDYGGYFASINRNKRSIVLDLRSDEDRECFLDLAVTADAVVENSRVGVMDRLGVGYEVLRAVNPRLVYAAIRGFGDPRTGASPYAEWPAFDIVAQCMGGLVGITGPTDRTGYPNGASIGDIFPGVLMALGVVSAVHSARRTGQGQFLDVAMYDAILSLCETIVINYSCAERVLGPRGLGHPALCPFDVYETSDGAVAIAAPTDNHWEALCELIGRPDLVTDERTQDNRRRSDNRPFVTEIMTAWTRARTKKQVVERLGGKVPVGPVNTAADVFADPHVWIRKMLAEVELPGANGKLTLAASPIKLTATPAGIYRRPPLLGEHTAEILAELRQREGIEMSIRLRRSELSTPGSNPKMIEKAAQSAADLVFLDLEDAVAPAQKVAARDHVIRGLRELDWGKKLRAVRVNDAQTEWAYGDVISVVEGAGEHLDLLILPKVKAPRDVWFFETLLAELEKKLHLKKQIGLEALIEETEALSRVEEIAGCSSRLEALILGFGDLSASQGMRFGAGDGREHYPGDIWHHARARMIIACRAHGIDAIDGPFANFKDPEGYRRDATWAAMLGAVGKWAIHPSQIEIANDVFAPNDREIDAARKMYEAYRAAEQAGAGAAGAGGVLVDAAAQRIFEGVLERARLSGRAT